MCSQAQPVLSTVHLTNSGRQLWSGPCWPRRLRSCLSCRAPRERPGKGSRWSATPASTRRSRCVGLAWDERAAGAGLELHTWMEALRPGHGARLPFTPLLACSLGAPVQPPGKWPAHPGGLAPHLGPSGPRSWLWVTESHSWSIVAPCRVLAHPGFGGPISSEHTLPFHMSSWTTSPFCINFIVFQVQTTPTSESRGPQPEHCPQLGLGPPCWEL